MNDGYIDDNGDCYEEIFSRQLRAQAKHGDIFVGISTSGNSLNVLRAVEICDELGVYASVFCGREGKLASIADLVIEVSSKETSFTQECHICIDHIVCGIVEEAIFSGLK